MSVIPLSEKSNPLFATLSACFAIAFTNGWFGVIGTPAGTFTLRMILLR